MLFILVCVVVQNVSTRVNLDHVLKLGVNDEVNRVGECLSKMKLDTKISLFYKLKMITRAVVWGQVKEERCVARSTIPSIFDCQHPGRAFLFQKKGLKSGYEILTASLTKFEKQGFSRYLAVSRPRILTPTWVRLWSVISFCIHHYTYQTLWNVSQEEVIRRKTTEPSGDGENFTIHSMNGILGSRLL